MYRNTIEKKKKENNIKIEKKKIDLRHFPHNYAITVRRK